MMVCFWWDIGLLPLFGIMLCAAFMGVMPDFDQDLNIPHRTSTHNIFFVMIVAMVITLFVFVLFGLIQIYVPAIEWLIKYEIVTSLGFPIPAVADPWWSSRFLWSYVAIALAGVSHLALDVDTRSGLKVAGQSVKGVFHSDGGANTLFSVLGYILILFGLSGSVLVNLLHVVPSFWFNTGIGVALIISTVAVVSSITTRTHQSLVPLHCGKVHGVAICSRKPCININGEKICLDHDPRSPSA